MKYTRCGAETSSILFAHNAGLTPKIANPKLWQRRHQTTVGGEVRVESRHPPRDEEIRDFFMRYVSYISLRAVTRNRFQSFLL
jgi:hypothetical protein